MKNDLSNLTFGIFTVLCRDHFFVPKSGQHYRWKCKCNNCGNIIIKTSNNLKNNNIKCPRCPIYFINKMVGKKFGRLTVLEFGKNNKKNFWRCRCKCGKLCEVSTQNLTQGHTKSCGCLQNETRKIEIGKATFNRVVNQYKKRALKKGLRWELSDKECLQLFSGNCSYCGRNPTNTQKGPNGNFTYNGIDRVNNEDGYTMGNCQTLCKICNIAKNKYSVSEFKEWIENIKNIPSSLKDFKEFYLLREKDESGVSGIGIVARGIIFPKDNKVVLEWQSEFNTITIFDNLEEVREIHGHNGKTKIVFGSPPIEKHEIKLT